MGLGLPKRGSAAACVPVTSPPPVAGCCCKPSARCWLPTLHPCRRTKRVVEEAVSPALTLAMRAMYQSRVSLQADILLAMLWPTCDVLANLRCCGQLAMFWLTCDAVAKLAVPLHTPSSSERKGAGNAAAAAGADTLACCTWLGPGAVLWHRTAPALRPLYLPLDQAGKYLLRRGGGLKKLRQMTGG